MFAKHPTVHRYIGKVVVLGVQTPSLDAMKPEALNEIHRSLILLIKCFSQTRIERFFPYSLILLMVRRRKRSNFRDQI